MDNQKRLPGGFDEHDLTRLRFGGEDFIKKHKRKIGCGCFALILLVVALVVLSILAPYLLGGQGEVEYDDMGRPGVTRSV